MIRFFFNNVCYFDLCWEYFLIINLMIEIVLEIVKIISDFLD